MIRTTRRAALGAALATPATLRAQPRFPDRPIRLICPWGAGGSTDIQMRAFAEAAARQLGQPVIIENRTGAGGTIGPAMLLNARPDGYLLSQMPISVFRFPYMTATPGWDPLTDFTYITHLTGYLFGTVVRADSPFRTMADMVAWAKANPGRLSYGTPGVGTSLHITMEQIAQLTGCEFLHVPFRGVAENTTNLLSGSIMVTSDSSGWGPLVEEGKLRLLATWGPTRAKRYPDAPTLREAGIDLVSASPYGIGGPKGMDPAVVRTLDEAFGRALMDPAHLAVLDRFDMLPIHLDHEAYSADVRRSVAVESEMVRRLGLKV